MSRYHVELMVGRILTVEVETDNADNAEAIGRYLFTHHRHRAFQDDGEELIHVTAEPLDGEGGQ